MTNELANEEELIRSMYPITNDDDYDSDGMDVKFQFSENGSIIEANLYWDNDTSLHDFVNETCYKQYKLPIYLKDSITYHLIELQRDRLLQSNDDMVNDFFYSDGANDQVDVGECDEEVFETHHHTTSQFKSSFWDVGVDPSLFNRLFHSNTLNQLQLIQTANDLRCAFQDRYKEREKEIEQLENR